MNTNWQRETDQIEVPEGLVTQAINRGIAQAAAKRAHHRIELVIIAAIMILAATINPITLEAGGVVPAVRQLLDADGKKTHRFDPAMNKVFGDLSDASAYQTVKSAAVTAAGIRIQVIGTMASAGMQGLVIDYAGPRIDPAALRRQELQISLNHYPQVIDLEQNYEQISIGHYRQFVAFYVNSDTDAKANAVSVRVNKVNGTTNEVTLPSVNAASGPVRVLHPRIKTGTPVDGEAGIDRLLVSPKSFVLDYSVTFDMQRISDNQAKRIKQGAWLSEADVIVNKKVIGTLMLGLGGTKLHEVQNGNLYVGRYQSIFASQCYIGNTERYVALDQVNPKAIINFKLQIPGEGAKRQRLANLEIPISTLVLQDHSADSSR